MRNELGRYLRPCIAHLLEFCDTVVVLDDASDDGTRDWLLDHETDRLRTARLPTPHFFRHEGRTRQKLLDVTFEVKPTHVLSIDADEFIDDGKTLRRQLEQFPDAPVVPLLMQEVWRAEPESLLIREDGGWRSHPLPYVWRVDPNVRYRIMDRALACRRVPTQVFRLPASSLSEVGLMHFGWTNEAERAARHARYVEHDGGRFHNRAHLDSIMWGDEQVTLRPRPWPEGAVFDGLRERLVWPPERKAAFRKTLATIKPPL